MTQDMTARQLLRKLQTLLKEEPEVGDLPAVVIDEGRLLNIVSVDSSTLHAGMLLLGGRDYDRPRSRDELPSSEDVPAFWPGPEGL